MISACLLAVLMAGASPAAEWRAREPGAEVAPLALDNLPFFKKEKLCGSTSCAVSLGYRRWPTLWLPEKARFVQTCEGLSMSLGEIRIPALEKYADSAEIDAGWAHLRLAYKKDEWDNAEIIFSRLSPWIYVSTTTGSAVLFGECLGWFHAPWANAAKLYESGALAPVAKAGVKFAFTGEKAPLEPERFDISGRSAHSFYLWQSIPRHFVFVSGGKPVYCDASVMTSKAAWGDGLGMDEPWMLMWFGEASHLFHAREGTYGHRFQGGGDPHLQCDMPALLRFKQAPSGICITEDGLEISSDADLEFAFMPLYGAAYPPAAETETWARKLPDSVVERCRALAACAARIPVSVSEKWLAEENGNVARFEEKFEWRDLAGDWDFPSRSLAPLPGMLALALRGGFPVAFEVNGKTAAPFDTGALTPAGAWAGLENADGYVMTVKDMARFALERPLPVSAAARDSREGKRLIAELERMFQAGHLAPAANLYGKFAHTVDFHWANPGETAAAIALAWPLLDDDLRGQARAYMCAELEAAPPFDLTIDRYSSGARREPFIFERDKVDTRDNAGGEFGHMPSPFYSEAEKRDLAWRNARFWLYDVYGLGMYACATDDAELAGKWLPEVRDRMARLMGGLGWDGIFARQRRSFEHDETQNLFVYVNHAGYYNLALAGLAGWANLEAMAGEPEFRDAAVSWFARLAATRVGMQHYADAMKETGYWPGADDEEPGARELLVCDEYLSLLANDRINWHSTQLTGFQFLTPGVARLLGQYAAAPAAARLAWIDKHHASWYLSEGPTTFSWEQHILPLSFTGGNFMAFALAGGADHALLRGRLDPSRHLGDLFFISNLALTCMRADNGPLWSGE